MDNMNRGNPKIGGDGHKYEKSDIALAADKLLNEGKNFATALCKDGLNKVEQSQETVKEFSDDLVKKIQNNPLTSLLVAAGVGFLLSSLLRKK